MYSLEEVKKVDPEVAAAITDEEARQNSHIELIASENWVSKAVMAAMGSILTNKAKKRSSVFFVLQTLRRSVDTMS